jgi:predicted transcriptional regulator
MSLAKQINAIVEQMPEKKQMLLLELVKTMVAPDDILTAEDVADIRQARAEFAKGEFVRHEDIDWIGNL